jgi:hypothetical protein
MALSLDVLWFRGLEQYILVAEQVNTHLSISLSIYLKSVFYQADKWCIES